MTINAGGTGAGGGGLASEKSRHDKEDVDKSTLAGHHTLGTFRHQAAGGNHSHTREDPTSLPLFDGLNINLSDPLALATILDLYGADVTYDIDEDWRYPGLLNGWQDRTDFGMDTVRYRKLSTGLVICQGTVKNGGLDQDIWVMPAGYRPGHRLVFAQHGVAAADYPQRIDILAQGNVRPVAEVSGREYLSVSGIIYFAEG